MHNLHKVLMFVNIFCLCLCHILIVCFLLVLFSLYYFFFRMFMVVPSLFFPVLYRGVLYHVYRNWRGLYLCPMSPYGPPILLVRYVYRSDQVLVPFGCVGERWVCRLCDKPVGSKSSLGSHMERCHVSYNGSDSSYIFYCVCCGYLFRDSERFRSHYSKCRVICLMK